MPGGLISTPGGNSRSSADGCVDPGKKTRSSTDDDDPFSSTPSGIEFSNIIFSLFSFNFANACYTLGPGGYTLGLFTDIYGISLWSAIWIFALFCTQRFF